MSIKTREALNQLLGLIDNEILVFNKSLDPSDISQAQYHIDKAVEAYEESTLNCEVGTMREQKKRFDKYCSSRKCYECPAYFEKSVDCGLWWSQMPYKSKTTK